MSQALLPKESKNSPSPLAMGGGGSAVSQTETWSPHADFEHVFLSCWGPWLLRAALIICLLGLCLFLFHEL